MPNEMENTEEVAQDVPEASARGWIKWLGNAAEAPVIGDWVSLGLLIIPLIPFIIIGDKLGLYEGCWSWRRRLLDNFVRGLARLAKVSAKADGNHHLFLLYSLYLAFVGGHRRRSVRTSIHFWFSLSPDMSVVKTYRSWKAYKKSNAA